MLPKGFKFQSWRFSKFDSPTSSGSRSRIVYSGVYDDEGRLVLEEVGTEDVYDLIQSHANEVDMDTILRRYKNGDVDVLNKVSGFYYDISGLSDNPADLLNKLNRAKAEFEELPVEFKEKYGNDFARFICTFDISDLLGDSSDDVRSLEPVQDDVMDGE